MLIILKRFRHGLRFNNYSGKYYFLFGEYFLFVKHASIIRHQNQLFALCYLIILGCRKVSKLFIMYNYHFYNNRTANRYIITIK